MTEALNRIPEFGSQAEHVEQLNSALWTLTMHNSNHSPQPLVTDLYRVPAGTGRTDELDPDSFVSVEPSDEPRVMEKLPAAEGQALGEGILDAAGLGALRSAGLRLGEPRQTVVITRGPQDSAKAGTVRTELEDGEAFCAFLDRILEYGNVDPGFDKTLRSIGSHFLDDLFDHFISGVENPAVAQIIARSGEVADRLEAFEFAPSFNRDFVQPFRECHYHAQTGTVREWAIATKLGLLDPAETQLRKRTGPGIIHLEGDPDRAAACWEQVLTLLDITRDNEAGQVFYAALLKAARGNFIYARHYWQASRSRVQEGKDSTLNQRFATLFETLGQRLGEYV